MNGWKSARLGRLGICCVKKCSLKSTLCCLTPLFICLFVFYFLFFISISSYQVKLGFSFGRLQKILCLVFLFVCCFFPPRFFSFVSIYFFPKRVWDFFPKSPILEFTCWDSLNSFPPRFCYCFYFLWFTFEVTAFSSKLSFIKGEPAQFRFHSSEFSVSIMHSSLLS